MHDALTRRPVPRWLREITESEITDERSAFPLRSLLSESLYYPAARFDPLPIKHLGGFVHSFVYADYGVTEAELGAELEARGFAGYRLLGHRVLRKEELAPPAWVPPIWPKMSEREFARHDRSSGNAFGHWSVWQREPTRDEGHGPERFSLLYLASEGAALFLATYARLRIQPEVLAIIQPGYGFGGNWTNFEDRNGFFAECVALAGQVGPAYLLHGWQGAQRPRWDRCCWPGYEEKCFDLTGKTNLCLWRRGVHADE